MYTPHTVTLIISEEDSFNVAVLHGVFLDLGKRSNVMRSGLQDADSATLFVPFSVDCDKQYVPPREYLSRDDKSGLWTLLDGDNDSGLECYFIKGEVLENLWPYSAARLNHDYCFRVSSVDLRDFGRESMRHWMVGGR